MKMKEDFNLEKEDINSEKNNQLHSFSVDYFGNELADDIDFFVDPPTEIGKVVSGYSNCHLDDKEMLPLERFFMVLRTIIISMFLGLLAIEIFNFMDFLQYKGTPLMVLALFSITGLYVGYNSTFFNKECRYVGEKGIAFFKAKKSRDIIEQDMVLRFEDVTDLLVSLRKSDMKDGYYFNFNYQWYNGLDLKHFINGKYFKKFFEEDIPTYDMYFEGYNDYMFASMAEEAWTQYLIEQVNKELEENNFVKFKVEGNSFVKLSSYFIQYNDKVVFISDIYEVKFKDGVITFYYKDKAKINLEKKDNEYLIKVNDSMFFIKDGNSERLIKELDESEVEEYLSRKTEQEIAERSEGDSFSLEVSQLSNSQVFFMMLDQMVGIPFDFEDVYLNSIEKTFF